jgi:L-asparaginase
MAVRTIAIISTGGTIEKTYDEINGALSNEFRVLDIMLGSLQLGGVALTRVPLMNKDSLEMTSDDHQLIAGTAITMAEECDGVVVVHGTDRLAVTGEQICTLNGSPASPIVLTGAMRPYELRHTDALQNLTEALMAVQLLEPGVYVAMHNKVLQFPGVQKDPTRGTFIKRGD